VLADADPDRSLSDATVQLLRELVEGEDKALSAESLRTLRGVVADRAEEREKFSQLFQKIDDSNQQPNSDTQEWNAQVDLVFGRPVTWNTADVPDGGDPEAGRRIFFHPHSTGCFKCHTVHGRGGKVGPDLSVVARSMDRKKLAESIFEPSREISPQYVGWTFVMKSGRVHTGLVVGEGPGDRIQIGAADGTVQTIQREEIEEWQPSRTSIMPEKLHERLTPGEFRDLLAFLETLK
jgi:putative heme-binding domain-containing protein